MPLTRFLFDNILYEEQTKYKNSLGLVVHSFIGDVAIRSLRIENKQKKIVASIVTILVYWIFSVICGRSKFVPAIVSVNKP